MPFSEKILVKSQENDRKILKKVRKTLVKSLEKFLSLTCGNPVVDIVNSKFTENPALFIELSATH